MGHILCENRGDKPKMGPVCYERHWVREDDQSETCILALAILIALVNLKKCLVGTC